MTLAIERVMSENASEIDDALRKLWLLIHPRTLLRRNRFVVLFLLVVNSLRKSLKPVLRT